MYKNKLIIILLLMALISAIALSLIIGPVKISLAQALSAAGNMDSADKIILFKIRFPRMIAALLVGAGLAVAGCVFQAVLKNPLADPYTLGVSGGAALGATIGIIFKLTGFILPFWAFGGAILSVLFIYITAGRKKFSTEALILCGIIVNFICSSAVLLIFSLSSSEQIHSALFWLMGDLSAVDGQIIGIAAFIIIASIIIIYFLNRELDLLTLGEEKALQLGADPERTKKILFIISSLITGACVSVSGIIGFVGLMIPHAVRKFTGPKHNMLILSSALAGASFLLLSDSLSRIIIAPLELPVGVITGIIGGSTFLFLIIKSRKWNIF